jgi:hypothetical protein
MQDIRPDTGILQNKYKNYSDHSNMNIFMNFSSDGGSNVYSEILVSI